MALLEVKGLSKVFGGISAVDGLDFTVDGGGILSIIGPNGAGKTTLFNVLTGVYTPTEGHVILEGEEVTHLTPFERAAKGSGRVRTRGQIVGFDLRFPLFAFLAAILPTWI